MLTTTGNRALHAFQCFQCTVEIPEGEKVLRDAVRRSEIRIDPRGTSRSFDRLSIPTLVVQLITSHRIDGPRSRVELSRSFQFAPCFGPAPHAAQVVGVPLVAGRVIRIQCERVSVVGVRSGKIPEIPVLRRGDRDERFGVVRVELQRFLRRRHDFGRSFRHRHDTVANHHAVGIRQAGVRFRELRVAVDGLAEPLDRILETHFVAFVPGVEAPQVCVVRTRISRVTLRDHLASLSADALPQLHCQHVRNVALHRRERAGRGVELLAPKLCSIFDVDQLDVDRVIIPAVADIADHDGVDVQRASGFFRVDRFSFVTEDCRARHDAKVGQARKRVDKNLGQAVAQMLRLRIVVRERKDRDGVDRVRRRQRRTRTDEDERRDDCNGERGDHDRNQQPLFLAWLLNVPGDRRDEPVTAARQSLDEPRIFVGVVERLAQFSDGRVQAVIEVDELGRP